jgi:hypothetical protein
MGRDDVCVIGAGPYGLTAAAHLRAMGLNVRIFGEVMSFWRAMPCGMLLRSTREGISLRDPRQALSLDDYERHRTVPLATPIERSDYIAYAEWYQRAAVPDVDPRKVHRVDRIDGGFRLRLEDGETIEAARVVVAIGIDPFKRRLPVFDALAAERAPHSFDIGDPGKHAGERVIVVGSGQSALESAVLLTEAGAEVELIMRGSGIRWLPHSDHIDREASFWMHLLYPPGALGPPGINWIVQLPWLYRALPAAAQKLVFGRTVPPAVSGRLKPQTERITQTYVRVVTGAEPVGGRIRVRLNDGTDRLVDHVVQGTGFQIEVDKFGFLSPEIAGSIRTIGGQPRLGPGLESSVPGLHFLGWASDLSYGPLMRAIAGTSFSAHALAARAAAGLARPGLLARGKTLEMLEQGIGLVPNIATSTATAAAMVGMVAPALGVDAGTVQEIVNAPHIPM